MRQVKGIVNVNFHVCVVSIAAYDKKLLKHVCSNLESAEELIVEKHYEKS